MKTKIIYISGSEIFEINDIRAAFEEVRSALKLSPDTVLFGVPVDAEDAGFAGNSTDFIPQESSKKIEDIVEDDVPEIKDKDKDTIETIEPTVIVKETEIRIESAEPEKQKKRGRPHKEIIKNLTDVPETVADDTTETDKNESVKNESDTEIVPILSVLGAQTEDKVKETEPEIDIIPEITDNEPEIAQDVVEDKVEGINATDDEDDEDARLEKLLSAMTPLAEDILENEPVEDDAPISEEETDVSVDATLEQLASEFIENQDKIAAESKSASRSKIGKLRNILPFKQSKHKDSGLGDLFGWAGIAANDEDFSVPGFFTSAASKK